MIDSNLQSFKLKAVVCYVAAAAFIGFKFHYIKTSNDKHLQTFNNYYYDFSSISKFC